MIIYQFPATLNVKFHRNQHGLSDTRKSGILIKRQRKEKGEHTALQIKRRKGNLGCKIDGIFSRGDVSNGRSIRFAGHYAEKQCGDLGEQANTGLDRFQRSKILLEIAGLR